MVIMFTQLEKSRIDLKTLGSVVDGCGDIFADIRASSPMAVARDITQPAMAGATARYAHLALTGQLYVDKGSMARVIAGSNSPVVKRNRCTKYTLELSAHAREDGLVSVH